MNNHKYIAKYSDIYKCWIVINYKIVICTCPWGTLEFQEKTATQIADLLQRAEDERKEYEDNIKTEEYLNEQ